jgi:Protein of unknown function (DUF2514)
MTPLMLLSPAKAVLSLLGKIPWWVWPVVGLALWGWWGHQKAKSAAERAASAENAAATATELAKRTKEARDEEHRRISEQAAVAADQAAKAAKDRAAAAKDRAAADSATASVNRLLDYVKRSGAASAPSNDPAATARSEAADRLGETSRACIQEYRELGELAIEAARRGEACEGHYGALNKPAPQLKEKP